METFATALAGSLRLVLSRVALANNGEAFYFGFMDESDLASGPITGLVPIEPLLARAALNGAAAPVSDAEHIATIVKVVDDGPIRSALSIGSPECSAPGPVRAFFQQIDAIVEAEQIEASLRSSDARGGASPRRTRGL